MCVAVRRPRTLISMVVLIAPTLQRILNKKVPKNRNKRPDIYRAEQYGKWETSDKAGKRNKSKGVAQHTPG